MELRVFAKANFIGLRRGVCLSVMILVAALGMPTLAMAQVARNTATVTPPGGVTNPGTQCVAPAVFTPATGVCASTDEDPITRTSDLTIVKTEREGSTAGFIAGPLTVGIGATVEFRIVVGNGGPSPLTGAVFRDVVPTNFSALSVVSVVPSVAPEVAASACTANIAGNTLSGVFSGPMGSSCSVIIRGTASIAAAAPGVTNTATATPPEGTTDPNGASSSVQTIINAPALKLSKSGTLSTDKKTISYSFVVENTGNVDLTAVTVTDPKLPALSCPPITLAVGASQTLICTGNVYTVSSLDNAAGKVDNAATASGTPPSGPAVSANDTATVPLQATPALKLSKSGTLSTDKKTISYSFVVENTGNVDLTAVTVTDPKLPALSCPPITLAVGASQTLICTGNVYTVSSLDNAAGKVDNTATASGIPPSGPAVSTTGTATVPLQAAPALTLSKSGTLSADQASISYSFTVTNTGNVDLSNVTLTDPLLPALDCPAITLPVGASQTLVCTNNSHATTAADYVSGSVVNTATVTAVPPGTNTPITATDTVTTPLVNSLNPVDDARTTAQNTSVTVDVQANDTVVGARLNPLSVTILSNPSHGTFSLNPDGTVVYTPNTNFSGVDTFVYQICNTASPTPVCKSATVTITVPPNRIDAVDDSARTPLDTPVSLNVIGNDTTAGLPLDPASVTVVTPPTHGAVSCNAGSCLYTPNPGYVGEDSFVYRVCDVSQPIPVCDTATATISIEGNTQVRLSKQASPRDVKVGDLVRYTVTMENVGETEVVDASLVDTPPPGFTLVVGSLQVADRDGAGRLAGSYPIRVDQIDIDKGARATISYLLRVGAGVRGGLHVNAAEVHDNGRRISNVATATVQMVPDPMTDEATLLGTVFDDRDGDGWQDSAEMSDIRVQGGFVPGAYIANSTTVDRGNGQQPEADASAPLLHGIALGRIGGRQSDADPAQARQVVVSQRLRSLDFSNDFVLTTAQGNTLRMDAAGNTTLSADSGDAARGLSAATPSVQRTVSPAEQGYRVDYIIRNEGVDERGVPGVRIASVEGLLVETDQYGRYNLIGVDAGRDDRGRNFILKVDPATLPPGSVFTTRNPLLRRVTPGLPVRFDFGVKLPPALLQGGVTQPVVMELGAVMFAAGSAQLRSEYLPVVESMAAQVRSHGGGEVVIGAQGESELLAFDRAVTLRKALVAALPADVAALTRISLRTDSGDDSRRVLELGAWPLLGTAFFDTDKASIKPEYDALLAHIVSYLLEMDVPTIKVIGHADRRASAAYNDALGMRRAKAVFDALSAQLPAAQRGRIKVEILPGEPDASSGQADAEATP
ncbi:hypothetical protein ABB27_09320 [Stenotrophomonas terrae]|uniref:OmpA-like domain-containing protein n=2 Tax=Stenotrophomonas terrae TaxID=405446 RepID=A0A0R0CDU3_9GAMM|nr:hypothetical protein ABB27_09320 [Stenotrophomonas terrae]